MDLAVGLAAFCLALGGSSSKPWRGLAAVVVRWRAEPLWVWLFGASEAVFVIPLARRAPVGLVVWRFEDGIRRPLARRAPVALVVWRFRGGIRHSAFLSPWLRVLRA